MLTQLWKKEKEKTTQTTLLMENIFTPAESRDVHCPWTKLRGIEECR